MEAARPFATVAPLSRAEFDALMAAAPGHLHSGALLLSVSLGVEGGPTELLALTWADVDLERGVIRVWGANKNPNRPFRDIPIRADVLRPLKIWKEEDHKLQPETIVHFKGNPVKSIKTSWDTLMPQWC
jgi:integrase